jgi:hypothetical protein
MIKTTEKRRQNSYNPYTRHLVKHLSRKYIIVSRARLTQLAAARMLTAAVEELPGYDSG